MRNDLLLSAPKVKRTHCYVLNPARYEISCPLCQGTHIEWSEYEKHIWCYDCKKDVFLPLLMAGIFGGPIPTQVAEMLGLSFSRINIDTREVITIHQNEAFNQSWVRDEALFEYEKMVNELISKDINNGGKST